MSVIVRGSLRGTVASLTTVRGRAGVRLERAPSYRAWCTCHALLCESERWPSYWAWPRKSIRQLALGVPLEHDAWIETDDRRRPVLHVQWRTGVRNGYVRIPAILLLPSDWREHRRAS